MSEVLGLYTGPVVIYSSFCRPF